MGGCFCLPPYKEIVYFLLGKGQAMLRTAIAATALIVVLVAAPWLNFVIVTSLAAAPRVRNVIAHRARGFEAPDQSAEAIRAAQKHGYPVEIDVTLEGGALTVPSPDTLETLLNTGSALTFHPKAASWQGIESVSRQLLAVVKGRKARYTFFLQSFTDCANKAQFVADFSMHELFFDVSDTRDFKSIRPFITDTARQGFAVTDTIAMRNDRLIRKIGQLKSLLLVYIVGHPRQIYNVPVTHIETDDPRRFESVGAASSVAGNVYLGTIFIIVLASMILATAAAIALHCPPDNALIKSRDAQTDGAGATLL